MSKDIKGKKWFTVIQWTDLSEKTSETDAHLVEFRFFWVTVGALCGCCSWA